MTVPSSEIFGHFSSANLGRVQGLPTWFWSMNWVEGRVTETLPKLGLALGQGDHGVKGGVLGALGGAFEGEGDLRGEFKPATTGDGEGGTERGGGADRRDRLGR